MILGCSDGVRGVLHSPRIGLEHNRPARSFDSDAPTARSVTRRQRVGGDLVHVVTTGFARADRGLGLVEGIDVDDGGGGKY